MVRSKILALPDKIAPRLATAPREPAAVALILRHALFEVLAEIADKAHEGSPAPSERSGGALPLSCLFMPAVLRWPGASLWSAAKQ